RGNGRHRQLAHPAWFVSALQDIDFDFWRFRLSQQRVVVEVALSDSAVLDVNPSMQRSGESEDDRTFNLGPDAPGIDDQAAIHCTPNLSDMGSSPLFRHLRNLSDMASKARTDRHSKRRTSGRIGPT